MKTKVLIINLIISILIPVSLIAAPEKGIILKQEKTGLNEENKKELAKTFQYQKPALQIQGMASIIGAGGSIGYHFNNVLFLGLETASLKFNTEEIDKNNAHNNEALNIDANLNTTVFVLRISPFSGSFYLQAGIISRDWKINAYGTSLIGDTGIPGRINGSIKYPSNATILSLGWNWISSFGLSGGLQLGVITGASPEADVKVAVLDSAEATQLLQAEIDKEVEEVKKDLDKYKTIPCLSIYLGWNF